MDFLIADSAQPKAGSLFFRLFMFCMCSTPATKLFQFDLPFNKLSILA